MAFPIREGLRSIPGSLGLGDRTQSSERDRSKASRDIEPVPILDQGDGDSKTETDRQREGVWRQRLELAELGGSPTLPL